MSTIDKQREKWISKTLSYFLRHHAKEAGLEVLKGGWVKKKDLMKIINKNAKSPISIEEIEYVVKNNDKQRYSIKEEFIRANQGHSFEIDLELEERTPPKILYHGTHKGAIDAIFESGLNKMSRNHVHLSEDLKMVKNVGGRRGKPIILKIDTISMIQDGFKFYISDNGVWLVDSVPKKYLKIFNSR